MGVAGEISRDEKSIVYDWGQSETPILKGTYKNEHASGEIKSWILSQEEMKDYIKKITKPVIKGAFGL